MLFIKIQYKRTEIITAIMTQLFLKEGLKEWVTKYHNTVHYNMKQLHFRNTFKPMHWIELVDTQENSIL